jgi:small-conductance mechanosensitive channel
MGWQEILDFEIVHMSGYKLQIANVIGVLVVIFITILFLALMKRIIERPKLGISVMDKKQRHSIFLLLKYFTWVIAVVVLLEVVGLKVSILLAGSAALLVGIGFGLQPIFADLVSGLFLLFEGTIKIGDVIEADGIVGRINEIRLRSTNVLTRDNTIMIVPNSKFVVEKVINWSHNAESVRFVVDIGVAYESDVDRVMEVLKDTMERNDRIEKMPESFVRFNDFGDSSLDFQLIFWTLDPFGVENLKSDLRRDIHRTLASEGIIIPFPQRDLHLKSGAIK